VGGIGITTLMSQRAQGRAGKANSKKVTSNELAQVGTISANGDA
jgi:hypothetical protein